MEVRKDTDIKKGSQMNLVFRYFDFSQKLRLTGNW